MTYYFKITVKKGGCDGVEKCFSQSPAQKVKTMVQEAVNLVKAKGSGWIETPWPKPGQTKEMKCRAFLKGVTLGGRLLIIGAPLYLE